MSEQKTNPSLIHILVSWIGYAYLALSGKTSVLQRVSDPAYLDLVRNKKPILFAFWHNQQSFLAWAFRGINASVLVSRSRDGEFIAQVMKRLGLGSVRGSSSRAGSQALLQMVQELKDGRSMGISPDGPKGPPQTIHGGIVALAKATGAPVVAVGSSMRRQIVFNSWDKFRLPMPFSWNAVVTTRPFVIDKDIDDEEAKEKVRSELNRAEEKAHRIQKESPSLLNALFGSFLAFVYNVVMIFSFPLSFPIVAAKYGWKRSTRGFGERFARISLPPKKARRVWFHCASVGEWQALGPLLKNVLETPGLEPVITVSTPEARALIEKEHPEVLVCLLPADIPWVMKKWIKNLNPDVAMVVETELWPNMFRYLDRFSVPRFIVNGRFSERSRRGWKWGKPFLRRVLVVINRLYVRTPEDGNRFAQLGAFKEQIQVSGNLKIDKLVLSSMEERPKRKSDIFGFSNDTVLVAGSTWPGEEKMILGSVHKMEDPHARVILAPRRLERVKEVIEEVDRSQLSSSVWSEVKKTGKWDSRVLVVDTMGDLPRLYTASDIAFIGGSINPRGGQNPLEPAAAHLPIIMGPSMENFHAEADGLSRAGASLQIQEEKDLFSGIEKIFHDPSLRQDMGEKGGHFVRKQQGVCHRLWSDLRERLKI